MNEKNRILQGYVRKGKKFISPLKALTNVKPYGYVDDLLPELLWIALLHDHNDYHFGRDVLECVVKLSEKWEIYRSQTISLFNQHTFRYRMSRKSSC